MQRKTRKLTGRSVAGGIAVGRAEIHLEDPSVVPEYRLASEEEAEAEVHAFEEAVEAADEEALIDLEWARRNLPEKEAEIFAAQRAILKDPTLVEWVTDKIRTDQVNAAAAVRQRFDEFRAILGESGSEIIRNRIQDVSDAERMILGHMLGQPVGRDADDDLDPADSAAALEAASERVVLVAGNPPPSLLARVDPERIGGILCQEGAGMGHVAVLARALNLPTLIQVDGLLDQIREGDTVAVDADAGQVIINPDPKELARLRARERQLRILLPPEPSDPRALRVTRDGIRVHLLGNAGSQREVAAAARVDADGIGLYRTEVQYLSLGRLPTEAELVKAYSEAACSFVTEPVDIRLLDLGSDKHLPGAMTQRETNPALGLRSLRFLFENPAILRTQLRAILQAGADGPVRALLPMVSGAAEVETVRAIARECHEELRREGLRHSPDLPIGALIEHPAGVIMAPEIFESADFVSVGTNDLTMYILAADRDDPHLSQYYDPCHPAVVRALRDLATLARDIGRPLGVCGEIAADPTLTGLLVGLGIERLSMNPQWIVPVGQVVGSLDTSVWRQVALEAANLGTTEDVRRCLREAQPA